MSRTESRSQPSLSPPAGDSPGTGSRRAGEAITLRLDAGVSLPGEGTLQQALEIRLPDDPVGPRPIALVCLPGGGMNRRFFDLMPDAADASFSFARQMAARGFVVISIDPLGIGESSRPQDGYALTPELLAQANANVTGRVLDDLRQGRIAGAPALPGLRSVGLGHSMGALLTILQQAACRQHAALVLLGFGTRGLPEFVKPEVRELAADVGAVRARLVELARDMFRQPYPRITRSPRGDDLYGSAQVDSRGVNALKAALEPILPVPAYLSMLPGNVAPEAAVLDVPVFLGIGEKDMVGPPHAVPAAFTASRDLTLHILPATGHSHFLFPARTALFDRLAAWAGTLFTQAPES